MDSYVSLPQQRLFYSKSLQTFSIPVARTGSVQCSISVLLSDSSLQPSGMQYAGMEKVLQWGNNEEGIKYVEFEILETAHDLEYITITLKNFLRCKAAKFSQAIAAIGEAKYNNYPTIFGGFVLLSSKTMERKVNLADGVYTTTYIFLLPGDAILGEVRTIEGEFLLPPYRSVVKNPEWQGIVAISDSSPIPDGSLEIQILSLF